MVRSLFARTAWVFLLLLVAFQVFGMAVSYLYIVRPLLKNSVDDLAALIALSAQTWAELPAEALPFYQEELERNYRLRAEPARDALTGNVALLPYVHFLETSLSARLHQRVHIRQDADGDWYRVDIPVGARTVRFSFNRERIGTNPPVTAFSLFAANVLLSLLAAVLVARHLTRPLAQLAASAASVGRAEDVRDLEETGPLEVVTVVRSFNRMAQQVRQLLQNRTTLLAGVSHDLRTPIARMRMAIELYRDQPDPQLLDNMERWLQEMNELIGYFIEFTQGVQAGQRTALDLNDLVGEIVASARAGDAEVLWEPGAACQVTLPVLAAQRIVRNLLDNALRYGAGQGVEVAVECADGAARVEVRDRGPGIPADQRERVFQPFVRLEQSRSARTGGSGLGLAIAWQIAQAQGWELQLSPRAGGGTVASLRIR
jgi:two-component system osmolarity sensor histidine kinase EnvZ